MKAFYDACMAGEEVSAYIKVIGTSSADYYVPASIVKYSDYLILSQTVDVKSLKDLLESYAYVKSIKLTRDNYSINSNFAFEISDGWTMSGDVWDSNLYYAKEVVVYVSDPTGSGSMVTSHVAFDDTLGNHTYTHYVLPHPEYEETWHYDGSSINVSSGYTFQWAAYKT
jgi:hypothetical protein